LVHRCGRETAQAVRAVKTPPFQAGEHRGSHSNPDTHLIFTMVAQNIRTRKALEKVIEGGDPLDSLSSHGALSHAGSAWVKCALDPFHDYEISDLDGIPDIETEPSLVVRTQQSMVISNPGAGSWDCNIVNMPVDFSKTNSAANFSTAFGSYYPHSQPGNPMPGTFNITSNLESRMDGLQASIVVAGNPTFQGTGETRAFLSLDDYLVAGSPSDLQAYRIVASGFEVVNTTAPLDRAGACTVYEIGAPGEVSDINCVDADAGEARIGTVRNFRMPPVNMAEAKQTPGARTWHAEEGAYVVSKHRSEMGFSAVAKRDYVYASSASSNAAWTTYKAGREITTSATPAPLGEAAGCASHISNLNLCGAYFSGLSENTTLQVTWRCVIERLPGPFDLQNLALASPSAPYDPRALELYSHITAKLPPGVPVGYNDAGKYFRMIAAQIKAAVRQTLPLLPAIETALAASGHPVAAAALEGARTGAAAVRKNKAADKKKKAAVQNFGKP